MDFLTGGLEDLQVDVPVQLTSTSPDPTDVSVTVSSVSALNAAAVPAAISNSRRVCRLPTDFLLPGEG